MESNRKALTTFSWHQTYMGIKIPGVAGVEVPERLPSLAPPGLRHHSRVRSDRKFQAWPHPAGACTCPPRPALTQLPGCPRPQFPHLKNGAATSPPLPHPLRWGRGLADTAPGRCPSQTVGCGAPAAGPRLALSEDPLLAAASVSGSPRPGCPLPALGPTGSPCAEARGSWLHWGARLSSVRDLFPGGGSGHRCPLLEPGRRRG